MFTIVYGLLAIPLMGYCLALIANEVMYSDMGPHIANEVIPRGSQATILGEDCLLRVEIG